MEDCLVYTGHIFLSPAKYHGVWVNVLLFIQNFGKVLLALASVHCLSSFLSDVSKIWLLWSPIGARQRKVCSDSKINPDADASASCRLLKCNQISRGPTYGPSSFARLLWSGSSGSIYCGLSLLLPLDICFVFSLLFAQFALWVCLGHFSNAPSWCWSL